MKTITLFFLITILVTPSFAQQDATEGTACIGCEKTKASATKDLNTISSSAETKKEEMTCKQRLQSPLCQSLKGRKDLREDLLSCPDDIGADRVLGCSKGIGNSIAHLLAFAYGATVGVAKYAFSSEHRKEIEKKIDNMTSEIKPLIDIEMKKEIKKGTPSKLVKANAELNVVESIGSQILHQARIYARDQHKHWDCFSNEARSRKICTIVGDITGGPLLIAKAVQLLKKASKASIAKFYHKVTPRQAAFEKAFDKKLAKEIYSKVATPRGVIFHQQKAIAAALLVGRRKLLASGETTASRMFLPEVRSKVDKILKKAFPKKADRNKVIAAMAQREHQVLIPQTRPIDFQTNASLKRSSEGNYLFTKGQLNELQPIRIRQAGSKGEDVKFGLTRGKEPYVSMNELVKKNIVFFKTTTGEWHRVRSYSKNVAPYSRGEHIPSTAGYKVYFYEGSGKGSSRQLYLDKYGTLEDLRILSPEAVSRLPNAKRYSEPYIPPVSPSSTPLY